MKKVKFLLVSLISIFAFNINVFAASGSLGVSSSSVYVGDSFTVTANVSSAAAWNIHVSASGPVTGCVINQADATADAIKRDNIKKVGLLGTKFTMTQEFIINRLVSAGLEVVLPEPKDMELVNDVIFNELCLGKVLDSSRKEYQRIIQYMKEKGAEGVILGCTEIGMLIKEEDSVLPTYDTTIIHATAAAGKALD